MKPKTFSILVSVFVLAALLMTSGNAVVAQGPLPPQGSHPQSAGGAESVAPGMPHDLKPQSPEAVAANVNADGIFTYQGQLKFNSTPYDGACDFSFGIYDAATGGSLVDGPYPAINVAVSKGLFSAPISYQNWGPQRWIGIGVSCPHSASPSYTALSPRQKITAAPYANSLVPGSHTASVDAAGNTLTSVYISDYTFAGIDAYAYYTGTPGLYGYTGANANTPGIMGISGPTGVGRGNTGVLGLASKGTSANAHPSGGFYDAGGTFSGPNGVIGAASSDANDGYGVTGITTGTMGIGVYAEASASTGANYGVYGTSNSSSGTGVYGQAFASTGVNYGVYGRSSSSSGTAIYGTAPYTGVVGRASATSGNTVGVYGVVTSTDNADAIGVYGGESGGTGQYHTGNYVSSGVWGDSRDNLGVLGTSSYIGVVGNTTASGTYGAGVYGEAPSGGYAGYFNRNVYVGGNFSVGGTKAFKIDNPLDPKNQYLYHYAVESPQVQNVYNGTATLDTQGEAVVELPAYFSAINTGDYRYYLTAIGAPMPNLYIAEEIQGNTFKVAGGVAGKKVSWMVYGQRNDPWVRDNPQPDVVAKPEAEIGTYVYPQGYGQPESAGVSYRQVHPQGTYTTTAPEFTPQISTPPGPNSSSGAPTQP